MGMMPKKVERRLEIERQVREIMNSPSYKEKMKEYRREDILHGLVKLSFITCEYLEMTHRCKKAGLIKYLNFVRERVSELPNDHEYFVDANKYYLDEIGIDVLKMFGLQTSDTEERKYV